MIVTDILPFPAIVFKSSLFQGCQNSGLCGKALTHYYTMTTFDALVEKAYRKHVGKEENAGNRQFLVFPQCFLISFL